MKRMFLLLLTILVVGVPAADPGQGQTAPNILWIITDDQRSDSLVCYNRATTGKAESALGYVESPNIDSLAAEGVLFTVAYHERYVKLAAFLRGKLGRIGWTTPLVSLIRWRFFV